MNIRIHGCSVLDGSSPGGSRSADIFIDDGRIAAVGSMPPDFQAGHVIDGTNTIALPGLVNAHTHVSMSLFRNLADDLDLMDWLQNRIWPLEERMGPEDVYWGAMLSMAELIRSGVTACADMYFSMDKVAEAAVRSGLRLNAAVGLTGDREAAREKLRAFRDFHAGWNGAGDGLVQADIGPHAPYTCDDGCFEEAARCAGDLGCGIHVHLSETAGEVAECREKFGLSPVGLAERSGFFSHRTIAAHCVHVDARDIELLRSANVHVVHNPSSNLKLASGFARIGELRDAGVQLALGTDGSSSNNNLNMFEEMHIAAILAKSVAGDPKALPAGDVLSMATEGGAAALGLPAGTGRIEEGSPADLILVRTDSLHMQPLHDPLSALVYSAQGSDVDTVICNGQVLMERRELLTIDEEEVAAKAREAVERLQS
jgi:5-methylthioadenosine/S-adenosylhomocysteine deaminase